MHRSGLSMLNRKIWEKFGNQKYHLVLADSSKDLDTITSLIEGGKLKPILDKDSPYKFEDFGAAFAKQMSHKARGKLVIHVSDDNVVDNGGDDQKDDVKEEVDDNNKDAEKEEMYKINKRPKDDVSDNEADDAEVKTVDKMEEVKEDKKEEAPQNETEPEVVKDKEKDE